MTSPMNWAKALISTSSPKLVTPSERPASAVAAMLTTALTVRPPSSSPALVRTRPSRLVEVGAVVTRENFYFVLMRPRTPPRRIMRSPSSITE